MIIFILTLQFLFAQNLSDLPGLIPLTSIRQASSDLVYNGKMLSPDEARVLVANEKIKDLSLLDPDSTSILWQTKIGWSGEPDVFPKNPEAETTIDLTRPFEFLENTPEAVGRFGFAISQKDTLGTLRTYRVRLDTRNHNVLLRRNLLRKLGYNIPSTIYAPKLTITFKGDFSRDGFLHDLKKSTFLETERWGAEQSPSQIILTDAIIFPGAEDSFYNLARGDMTTAAIQNRRLLNALLVPFNFTDVTESVNVFSWNPGKVFNKQLSLPFEESFIFSTSYEDARWITRKILSLKTSDFEEIVANANYPIEIEKLITQKLISRRNFLAKHLNLENEYKELPVDTKVSYGDKLKDGKLAVADWPGYAQKFAYGDPDEPLSGDELFAFFKSKGISNILSNVVSQFNDRYLPRTDLGFKIFDHQLDLAVEQFAEFIQTGQIKKTPFAFWSTTFFNTNIIASREIVTGSYLGTDNLVQIADVIGFSVDAGLYIGTDGTPSPFNLSAGLRGFVTRTYAHVKPINSIKLALKEPFRNILVPKLKSDLGRKLQAVLTPEFQQLEQNEKQKLLSETLREFKDSLKVGESIIMTTSLGGALSINPSMGLTSRAAVYSSWSASQTVLNRLHIFRRDDNTIQVFKDPAHLTTGSISIGLEAYIPIVTFRFTKKGGKAETKFFTININSKLDENPEAVDHVRSLARLLSRSKTDALEVQQKPYVINHKFNETSSQWNIFISRYLSLKSEDWISVKHPNGFTKNYLRRTTGRRSGRNYEALSIDVINSLVREYSQEDILIASNNSGDPGDSFKGNSVSELFSFETEIKSENGRDWFSDPYINLNYKWRNWDISKEKLLSLIFDINSQFGYEFFHDDDLQQTQSIKLSTVELNVNIYEEGIKYLTNFTRKEIEQIFATDNVCPTYPITPGDQPGSQIRRLREERDARREIMYTSIFGGIFEKFQKAYADGDPDKTFEYLSKFVTFGERMLPAKVFYSLFGGENNLFVRSQIVGFREGDEREGRGLTSNTYGEIGSQKGNGPLREIQNKIGISESEFFIYWLLNKI